MSLSFARNILLFDLYQGGHHVQYIDQLGSAWLEGELPGRLDIIVHANVVETEPQLHHLVERGEGRVRLHGVRPAFDLEANRPLRLVLNDLEHGRLLKQAVRDLAPDHCLCMYLDHVQLSLACSLRLDRNTYVSGIYFRPSFHYGAFSPTGPTSVQTLAQRLKRALIGRAVMNQSFRFLFCLDPYVLAYLPDHPPHVKAIVLPDGVPSLPTTDGSSTVRARWQIPADRRLAVLFGSLDERKGIRQLLESALLLPQDAQERLTIMLSGKIRRDHSWIASLIRRVEQDTRVQVILDNRFVPESETANLLRASDFVLVPYQRHVGSSNVLIRAAQVERPVLGQSYGLMGEVIRRKGLGLAVDTCSPERIAESLSRFVLHPEQIPFDRESAVAYAASNSEACYARTILDHLYSA